MRNAFTVKPFRGSANDTLACGAANRAARHRNGNLAAVRTAAVALVAVALMSSCATLARATFSEPVVRFNNVAVTGIGLSGGSVDVVLSVYNPNGFNLNALSFTYRVDIDSVQLGAGQLADKFVVQKGDSTLIRLPIAFTYAGIGAAGRQLLQAGTVPYRVRGDITVSTPLGNFTRPYDQTGRYSAQLGGLLR